MFTGIIEEIGKIKSFSTKSSGARVEVDCHKVLSKSKIGDSIAINGCCTTVTMLGADCFCADVSHETLSITTFSSLKSGAAVNLERALTPASRMGGHIVQGHIDCIGKLLDFEKLDEFYNLTFEIPTNEAKYIVKKGSVAVDGVSLTVAQVNGNIFKTAVIPHTWENTALQNLSSGVSVNIETDILGRYIEKFLSADNNNSRINEQFLIENGFM